VTLMDTLECAAASMILLARPRLLVNSETAQVQDGRIEDPSDHIDTLINYTPLDDTTPLIDTITFLQTHDGQQSRSFAKDSWVKEIVSSYLDLNFIITS